LDMSIFSTVILATIITMSVTPYFIDFKDQIYKFLKYPVALLRFLPTKESLHYSDAEDKEILMIGSHRMGGALMEELLVKKDKLLVIDYNPEIINVLKNKKISCIYGDITSPELLDNVNIKKLKLVISTIPNYEETLYLIKKLKRISPRLKIVVNGSRISETLSLYKAGADYVVTPKIIAGQEVAKILSDDSPDFKAAKKKHLNHLGDIHKMLY